MIGLNQRPIFIRSKNIKYQWKQRKLIPICRLAVLKILSYQELIIKSLNFDITKLYLRHFLNDLSKEQYIFMWGSKIH